MSMLEDDLVELRRRTYFEIKPFYQDPPGWTLIVRGADNLWEARHVIIRDTLQEAVTEALERVEAPTPRTTPQRRSPGHTAAPAKPTAPTKKLIRRKA